MVSYQRARQLGFQSRLISYEPIMAADDETKTAWCSKANGKEGHGEWIEFDFGTEVQLSSFQIENGYYNDNANWEANWRVKKLSFITSDGNKTKFKINDSRRLQEFEFPKEITTNKIRLVIDDTFPGKESDFQVCITEVGFNGKYLNNPGNLNKPISNLVTVSTYDRHCNSAGEWINQILEEFPNVNPDVVIVDSVKYRMVINMFSDKYFKPIFGKTYNEIKYDQPSWVSNCRKYLEISNTDIFRAWHSWGDYIWPEIHKLRTLRKEIKELSTSLNDPGATITSDLIRKLESNLPPNNTLLVPSEVLMVKTLLERAKSRNTISEKEIFDNKLDKAVARATALNYDELVNFIANNGELYLKLKKSEQKKAVKRVHGKIAELLSPQVKSDSAYYDSLRTANASLPMLNSYFKHIEKKYADVKYIDGIYGFYSEVAISRYPDLEKVMKSPNSYETMKLMDKYYMALRVVKLDYIGENDYYSDAEYESAKPIIATFEKEKENGDLDAIYYAVETRGWEVFRLLEKQFMTLYKDESLQLSQIPDLNNYFGYDFDYTAYPNRIKTRARIKKAKIVFGRVEEIKRMQTFNSIKDLIAFRSKYYEGIDFPDGISDHYNYDAFNELNNHFLSVNESLILRAIREESDQFGLTYFEHMSKTLPDDSAIRKAIAEMNERLSFDNYDQVVAFYKNEKLKAIHASQNGLNYIKAYDWMIEGHRSKNYYDFLGLNVARWVFNGEFSKARKYPKVMESVLIQYILSKNDWCRNSADRKFSFSWENNRTEFDVLIMSGNPHLIPRQVTTIVDFPVYVEADLVAVYEQLIGSRRGINAWYGNPKRVPIVEDLISDMGCRNYSQFGDNLTRLFNNEPSLQTERIKTSPPTREMSTKFPQQERTVFLGCMEDQIKPFSDVSQRVYSQCACYHKEIDIRTKTFTQNTTDFSREYDERHASEYQLFMSNNPVRVRKLFNGCK